MTTIDLSDTSDSVSRFLRLAKDHAIVVTRGGKPFAAVMPLNDADWERIAVATDPRFRAIMARSARRYRKEGGLSAAEVRRQLGIAPKAKRPKA
jgi:hypothetical protein